MIRTTGKWLNHNSTQHKQNIAKDKFHSLKFRFFGSCFTFISHTYSSRLYDKQLLTASSAIHRSRSFAIFSYQNVCKGTHIFAWDGFRSFKICVCVWVKFIILKCLYVFVSTSKSFLGSCYLNTLIQKCSLVIFSFC